jgi:hypothetical protein
MKTRQLAMKPDTKVLLALIICCFATQFSFGDGVMTETETQLRTTNAQAEELQRNLLSRQRALYQSEEAAASAAQAVMTKRANLVFAPGPYQDKYGDPMYTAYGPLVGTDSPLYDGPRYVASFDRYAMLPMPDGEYRGYYRQAFSNPTLTARTDTTLGVGASQMYLQSNMMWNPGSMSPSAARVMTNNRW